MLFMHKRAPWRPQPVPVTGTFLSFTAHAALVAAVVGGDGPGGRAAPEATLRTGGMTQASGGEQLHWVGVGSGTGSAGAPKRTGEAPPSAYVIPGRGGLGYHTPGRDGAPNAAPAPVAAAAPSTLPAPSAELPRRPVRRIRLPRVSVPDAALPDATATLLVAGVISTAPDLTRRTSRPEDFAPPPPPSLASRASSGAAGTLVANVHVDDLPIPMVNNPPPVYPASLERMRVGGRVVVEFTIDSTGVVDPGSLKVVQSTNALFTRAVRSVLPQLRFMPALLDEHAVGVTVRQPFLFTMRSGY